MLQLPKFMTPVTTLTQTLIILTQLTLTVLRCISRVRHSYTVSQKISYPFQQCENCEYWLSFVKVTESLKVGTFLRHSV